MKSLIYNEKRAQQVNPFSSLKCLIFVMLASTNEALRDAQTTYTVLISNIKLVFAYWPLPDIGQIALSGIFSPLPFDYKDAFFAGTSSLNRLPLLQSQLPTATSYDHCRKTKTQLCKQLLHNYCTRHSQVKNCSPTKVENYPPVQPVKNYASNTAT